MKDLGKNPEFTLALGIFLGVFVTRVVDGNLWYTGLIFGVVAAFITWVAYKLIRG